jgi:hypothetical protein
MASTTAGEVTIELVEALVDAFSGVSDKPKPTFEESLAWLRRRRADRLARAEVAR